MLGLGDVNPQTVHGFGIVQVFQFEIAEPEDNASASQSSVQQADGVSVALPPVAPITQDATAWQKPAISVNAGVTAVTAVTQPLAAIELWVTAANSNSSSIGAANFIVTDAQLLATLIE